MAYYFQERIFHSPIRGMSGMGGGLVMSGAKSAGGGGPTLDCTASTADACYAQEYSWDGTQGGESVFNAGGLPGPSFDNCQRFTIQWDIYVDSAAQSNSWHMQATPGWYDGEGVLIGIFATRKVSIAGPQLGGYGFQANDNIPDETWTRIKYQFGVGGNGANQGQAIYYSSDDGATWTSQGSSNNYNQPSITWNQGIWAGAGRNTSTGTWQLPFAGDIRNFELWDEIV